MRACPACGEENPDRAKFCLECATPLAQPLSTREERKIVSVLFCDLVGSTALAEGKDPEDVRAVLRPYHELLKARIESFGGTVEKFIGDAVMAVFGAPVSHEDDAERAVRAGLRILESLEELNAERGSGLSVRIGINTGEVVVSLEARPEHGEGMVTGDVVNTAARLQTGAPVGGIAVGETTYLSTKDVFDYEPLRRSRPRARPEPVPAWRAVAARARFGTDVTRRHDVALVGRDAERAATQDPAGTGDQRPLLSARHDLGRSGCRQEPHDLRAPRAGRGTGRSRGLAPGTVSALRRGHRVLGARRDREGRGGDPRVRLARTGGGEARSSAPKASPSSPASSDGSGPAWLLSSASSRRARPNAMSRSPRGGDPSRRLAGSRASVFVFEDLHWADPGLLEFLEHVADLVEGVPMLLVCTARPELSERHPSWAGGLRNATTLNLAPLSEEATATLVGELLGEASYRSTCSARSSSGPEGTRSMRRSSSGC